MSNYNVFELVKEIEPFYYDVDPAVVFPATFTRIKEVLTGNVVPVELIPKDYKGNPWREPTVVRFLDRAALCNLDEPDKAALVLAENWYQRALTIEAGRGIRVHVQRNLEYRRR